MNKPLRAIEIGANFCIVSRRPLMKAAGVKAARQSSPDCLMKRLGLACDGECKHCCWLRASPARSSLFCACGGAVSWDQCSRMVPRPLCVACKAAEEPRAGMGRGHQSGGRRVCRDDRAACPASTDFWENMVRPDSRPSPGSRASGRGEAPGVRVEAAQFSFGRDYRRVEPRDCRADCDRGRGPVRHPAAACRSVCSRGAALTVPRGRNCRTRPKIRF